MLHEQVSFPEEATESQEDPLVHLLRRPQALESLPLSSRLQTLGGGITPLGLASRREP